MTATVLLVEDEEMLRVLLSEALSLIDLEIVCCRSADEAMITLEQAHPFSLVITDICMPGTLDGIELAEKIWHRWPHLPVIISSGNRVIRREKLPDNASFLRKPWSLEQLHQIVLHHLASE
ncbi:response regulator [Pseudomonas sp. RC10]|uniref:response regulator n=1 Tax=Pseudomonas bambusae TaxID=3139142 RepID=UPI00313879C5